MIARSSAPKARVALPSGKGSDPKLGVRPLGPPPKLGPPQTALEQPETLTTPFLPKVPPLGDVDDEVETLIAAIDEQPAKNPEPPAPAPANVKPPVKPPAPPPPAIAKPPPPAAPVPLPLLTPPRALVPLAMPEPSAAHLVLEQGKTIAGKYLLGKPAGFGGMAQLWVATNASTAAEVCIKVLVPDSSDEESVERFRREAYAAARLSHRAIVRIFDLVELDQNGGVVKSGKPDALAIVMELLRGETLGDVLMKKGHLPLDEALDIFLPVLSALGHAHRAGVVHRDLKPDNIFLAADPDGHVSPKVLDFGVSKVAGTGGAQPLTLDGVMLGTPSFMSPEQARGARNVDERSDVFSSGIVFYMMLTGKNPFEDDSFHSVVAAILDRDPVPIPELEPEIWAIIERALAKDPSARFNDATELAIALRKASGRKVISESGNHLAAPISGRFPHDGQGSVPPLGASSLAPPDQGLSLAPPPIAPNRQRAFRIVGVVVALSAILIVAAIVRSVIAKPDVPVDPNGRVVASTPPATAPVPTPVPTPSAVAVEPTATTTTTTTTTATAEPTATPTVSAPPRKKREVPPPGSVRPGEEPKNARDPGF